MLNHERSFYLEDFLDVEILSRVAMLGLWQFLSEVLFVKTLQPSPQRPGGTAQKRFPY